MTQEIDKLFPLDISLSARVVPSPDAIRFEISNRVGMNLSLSGSMTTLKLIIGLPSQSSWSAYIVLIMSPSPNHILGEK